MKGSYYFWPIIAVCAAISCVEASGKTRKAAVENPLCIHFYDLAGLPTKTTEQATMRVNRAFGDAGIKITWERPPIASEEAHLLDLSTSVLGFRPIDRPCVVVRIVPDLPPGTYSNAFGFALPDARFGIDIEVAYRRVERHAQSAGVLTDVALAYVMAHEIGHVLLHSSNHSWGGIMQAKVSAESWRLASFGVMQFLPAEAKEMRIRLSMMKESAHARDERAKRQGASMSTP